MLSQPVYGLEIATSQRVGFYLGAGEPKAARSVSLLCFIISMVFCPMVSVTLFLLRFRLGYVFSSSPAVVALIAKILPLTTACYTLMGGSADMD